MVAEVCPAAQAAQASAPVDAWKVPAAQEEQAVAPCEGNGANRPAAQVAQVVCTEAPTAVEYLAIQKKKQEGKNKK